MYHILPYLNFKGKIMGVGPQPKLGKNSPTVIGFILGFPIGIPFRAIVRNSEEFTGLADLRIYFILEKRTYLLLITIHNLYFIYNIEFNLKTYMSD